MWLSSSQAITGWILLCTERATCVQQPCHPLHASLPQGRGLIGCGQAFTVPCVCRHNHEPHVAFNEDFVQKMHIILCEVFFACMHGHTGTSCPRIMGSGALCNTTCRAEATPDALASWHRLPPLNQEALTLCHAVSPGDRAGL